MERFRDGEMLIGCFVLFPPVLIAFLLMVLFDYGRGKFNQFFQDS